MANALGYVQPWNTAGKSALNVYSSLLGLPGYETTFSPQEYLSNTPGYQWQFNQGQKALDAGAASRGMLLSGPQRQATTQYGQNYASNYYDKLMNQLNGLSTQGLGTGQTMGNWENEVANRRAGLQMRGAEGTVNAFDKVFQGQVAQHQADQAADQQGLNNILGIAGTVGGMFGGGGGGMVNALSGMFGGGSGGSSYGGAGSSYALPTSSWNNSYSNWLSGR